MNNPDGYTIRINKITKKWFVWWNHGQEILSQVPFDSYKDAIEACNNHSRELIQKGSKVK